MNHRNAIPANGTGFSAIATSAVMRIGQPTIPGQRDEGDGDSEQHKRSGQKHPKR